MYRKGSTVNNWEGTASNCRIYARESGLNKEFIEFEFSIASKGGGTTNLRLSFGEGDFHVLLDTIMGTEAGAKASIEILSRVLANRVKEEKEA